MARKINDFRTKVALNTEAMSVDVQIIKNDDDSVAAERSFAASGIHDSVKQQVGLYGLSKLLQDRASDKEVSPGKLDAMDEVYAQLAAGQWAKERKIGAVVVGVEVEALSRLKSWTIPQTQAALKTYAKEVREKILSNPAVTKIAEEIRAERAAQEVPDGSLDDLANVA